MEKRFGLKECFIVPRSYDLLAVKQAPGRAALQLLRRIVDNKQVIGFAWGTSIRELTRHAQNSKVPKIDADFVPLDGGVTIETAQALREAGANILVAGTAIYKSTDVLTSTFIQRFKLKKFFLSTADLRV